MTAGAEHLYIVTYDISDARRWRAVFKTMQGFGSWLQLSVFQCRLTRMRHAELLARLNSVIAVGEDHVMVIDLGLAESCEPRVATLGSKAFEAIDRKPIIV